MASSTLYRRTVFSKKDYIYFDIISVREKGQRRVKQLRHYRPYLTFLE